MTRNEISIVISELQAAGTAKYGSGTGHAWASGYLGSMLANALYQAIPVAERDTILRLISEQTRLMRAEITDRSYDEKVA